ncbi:MAG TPA: carboxypeptidase regulatory-like domain-containing protein [Candidatus Limnocylindrales bacterium]|nr:carboxypeptidase regulatory-like domain-containing protein [Candidatus Limnocylindrales bacterium]
MKTRFLQLALAALVAFAIVGCGGNKSSESEQPAAPAAGGATVDATTAGSVSGTVKLDGKAPAMRPINMSAEPYCQKANSKPVIPPEVVTGEDGSLANVVVYVKDDMSKYTFSTPSQSVPLAQQGCMYDPHVIALMAGQTLEVKNDDQTTHNIHPMPKDNREWNKSQPPGAAPIDDSFARAELAIPVKCNVHPWMKSYIFVFKNPYFAVTTKDGKFDLSNLPPGTYTIEAWQEKYGVQDQQVTIGPKESKTVSFTFKASGASGD